MRLLLDLHYLAPVGVYSLLSVCDEVFFETAEHFVKSSFRNRCYISGPNGIQRLSIPLTGGKNQRSRMDAVEIAYHENWQRKHWQSLQAAYRRSAFFEYYEDELAAVYQLRPKFLFEFNMQLFKLVVDLLGLDIGIRTTKKYEEHPAGMYDIRNSFLPNRISLPDELRPKPAGYLQMFHDPSAYKPNLSILDLLFAEGPRSADILRECAPLPRES